MQKDANHCLPALKRRRVDSSPPRSNGGRCLKSGTDLFVEFQDYVVEVATSGKKTELHINLWLLLFVLWNLKKYVQEIITNFIATLNPFSNRTGNEGISLDEVDCAPTRVRDFAYSNVEMTPSTVINPQKILLDQVNATLDKILPPPPDMLSQNYHLNNNDNFLLLKGCLYLHLDILRRLFSRVKTTLPQKPIDTHAHAQPGTAELNATEERCPFLMY